MRRPIRLGLMTLILLPWEASSSLASEKKNPPKEEKRLDQLSFQEILDRYVFIADFNQKPAERPISSETFWKYPFKPGPVSFDLDIDIKDLKNKIIPIKGSGDKIEAINTGRVSYLEGDYERAHKIWLVTRQLYKDDVKTNRILEFYLGINALTAYQAAITTNKDPEPTTGETLDKYLQRSAYFMASAFILRRDVTDYNIDPHAPWSLYNLAAIYYKFDRIPSAFGAASEGLSALIKYGGSTHRSHLRQILAESYIHNNDLLAALQELDTALRQDPDPIEASKILARVGDIYFDLNNYELATDLYEMASAIDKERRTFRADRALLRAESFFWLGEFTKSEQIFLSALDYAAKTPGNEWLIDKSGQQPWAQLRIGDTKLATFRKASNKQQAEKDLSKVRLAYYRVQSEFPKSEASHIAKIRETCLDLPQYQGNNVKHAREFLEKLKEEEDIPVHLTELIWACETESYVDRERSQRMVDKVKSFSEKFPNSPLLAKMLDPVREINGNAIDQYFEKKQWELATELFESKRSAWYKDLSKDRKAKLWRAYVETSRSSKASEFWPSVGLNMKSDEEALLKATYYYEIYGKNSNKQTKLDFIKLNHALTDRLWTDKPTKQSSKYVERIYTTPNAPNSFEWLIPLMKSWSKGQKDSLCESTFPLLSRATTDKNASARARSIARKELLEVTNDQLLSLQDQTCFQSILDLEAKILSTGDIKKRYESRLKWPLKDAWLERMWTWSEELQAKGQKESAIKIWNQIVKEAPQDSFEFKMARTRLDPTRTEFESLWNK